MDGDLTAAGEGMMNRLETMRLVRRRKVPAGDSYETRRRRKEIKETGERTAEEEETTALRPNATLEMEERGSGKMGDDGRQREEGKDEAVHGGFFGRRLIAFLCLLRSTARRVRSAVCGLRYAVYGLPVCGPRLQGRAAERRRVSTRAARAGGRGLPSGALGESARRKEGLTRWGLAGQREQWPWRRARGRLQRTGAKGRNGWEGDGFAAGRPERKEWGGVPDERGGAGTLGTSKRVGAPAEPYRNPDGAHRRQRGRVSK